MALWLPLTVVPKKNITETVKHSSNKNEFMHKKCVGRYLSIWLDMCTYGHLLLSLVPCTCQLHCLVVNFKSDFTTKPPITNQQVSNYFTFIDYSPKIFYYFPYHPTNKFTPKILLSSSSFIIHTLVQSPCFPWRFVSSFTQNPFGSYLIGTASSIALENFRSKFRSFFFFWALFDLITWNTILGSIWDFEDRIWVFSAGFGYPETERNLGILISFLI